MENRMLLWGGIGAVALLLYYLYAKGKAAATPLLTTAGTTQATGLAAIPVFGAALASLFGAYKGTVNKTIPGAASPTGGAVFAPGTEVVYGPPAPAVYGPTYAGIPGLGGGAPLIDGAISANPATDIVGDSTGFADSDVVALANIGFQEPSNG